jgi:hypothetical protein
MRPRLKPEFFVKEFFGNLSCWKVFENNLIGQEFMIESDCFFVENYCRIKPHEAVNEFYQ